MDRDVEPGEVVVTPAMAVQPRRLTSALEAVAFLVALLVYIWYFQARAPITWTALLAMLVVSQLVHGESPVALGVRWAGFGDCARRYALPVLVLGAAAIATGDALHTLRPVPATHVMGVFVGYIWWALLQQYLLNAFFVTRLTAAFGGRNGYLVAPLAGSFFAAAHMPNALLVYATLLAGTLSAIVYRRHRNLLFLALAHAMLGTMIWFVVPDSISHGLRVGPGMAGHHRAAASWRRSEAGLGNDYLTVRSQPMLCGTVANGSLVSSSRKNFSTPTCLAVRRTAL